MQYHCWRRTVVDTEEEDEPTKEVDLLHAVNNMGGCPLAARDDKITPSGYPLNDIIPDSANKPYDMADESRPLSTRRVPRVCRRLRWRTSSPVSPA